ncbi:c-type cytochrome domain-containing protein [Pricia sp. S334]|uniref:C-type cytochrome domain-containing protein n=1 Tax=Pricia mediterranea TaxID=3076079 RepID=A0ABU3L361_9FLAO|nr:c-type cytochrome domain-containing protein [Pricia sp. S334]MDT7828186.1 c-type cytochrome domain-containing protein [Pricia sp. S334]
MDVLLQLLGRLHPVIVHLPIGFIILGLLLQWYDRKIGQHTKVVALIYLWAGVSAALACITGYLQYLGEGYGFDTVKWHLWSGIATALFCFVMYLKIRSTGSTDRDVKIANFEHQIPKDQIIEQEQIDKSGSKRMTRTDLSDFLDSIPTLVLSVLFFMLISFTGHQGGNITHGEDYLVEPLPNSVKSALGFETFEEKEIVLNEENWEETLIYKDVIDPILNNKCVSCHNPKKTKGELLLNSEEGILTGGENGDVVVANHAADSELFVRMNLPLDDDDHMPPDGKTQPSKEEIALIGAWLDAGHPFAETIGESGLEKELFQSFFPKKVDNDYPDVEVAEASQDSIDRIKDQGIHVDQISKATNFLKISCLNKPSFSESDFALFEPLKIQIAVLDLGGTQVSDAVFEKLADLPHLTVLKLDHTEITGKGIEKLAATSKYLKSINLTGTNLQAPYFRKLAEFKKLQKVFVFDTPIDAADAKALKGGQITVDYGHYNLPAIASDSIVY